MLLQVTADDTGCILRSRLDNPRNGMGVAPISSITEMTGSDEPATLGAIGDGKVWGRCIRVYCELDERSGWYRHQTGNSRARGASYNPRGCYRRPFWPHSVGERERGKRHRYHWAHVMPCRYFSPLPFTNLHCLSSSIRFLHTFYSTS